MLEPKKPDGFCLSTTMSCGPGAIGVTISLPSRLLTMVCRSSLPREFFHSQDTEASGSDCRDAFLMALVDQRADIEQRDPGVLAAGIAPALDRFQDRLRPVAAERPIDVDDDERRPLAEAAARAIARRAEHRPVALGEKFVPDRFGHV